MGITITNIHKRKYDRTKDKVVSARLSKEEQGQLMHRLRRSFFDKDYIATFEQR